MTIIRICRLIATLGPFGYAFAPGTVASILTLPLVHMLQVNESPTIYIICVIVLLLFSICIVNTALQGMGKQRDPNEIVIDEVIGCLITFMAVPFNAKTIVLGLLLFRFFDISKIMGIKRVERLPDAWGIMFDDVIAGLLSNIILHIVIRVHW